MQNKNLEVPILINFVLMFMTHIPNSSYTLYYSLTKKNCIVKKKIITFNYMVINKLNTIFSRDNLIKI